MEYRRFGSEYYVRLDKGDEIISSLAEICAKEGIRAGSVKGIGGCGEATVGVFDIGKKAYDEHTVNAMLEMISLDGNITEYEGKPYIHAHASFAYHEDGEIRQLSGHLISAVICLTGELVITPAEGCIKRRYIEDLGIRIWEFE